MPVIAYNDVLKNPTAYKFLGPGAGYAYIGAPPVPNPPALIASMAEPPSTVVDMSWHLLTSPNGDTEVTMRWLKALKVWLPQNQLMSNRVGYTSAYLAAHGWVYLGAL